MISTRPGLLQSIQTCCHTLVMCFYASLLTGPAFDYADYDKFIHGTLFDDVPQDKDPEKQKKNT